ncbi:unnamed protein product [Triticum turgidum subsp. durum]|uniref:PHD and RING finger domain-containing protein 1 n=1 Tax=Triticum turgidum subsp. durum TaxID=4567 RepID=A0A9R1RHL6_TRITD|nr:unnamed protein product [Triticum turgidum subsp. durum]
MVAGGRAVLRRAKMGGDDDDDEYVVDEDEEEEVEEEDDAAVACSDEDAAEEEEEADPEPEPEDESDADFDGDAEEEEDDEDFEIDKPRQRPRRPPRPSPRPRGRGRKKAKSDDDDDSDAVSEEEDDDEDFEIDAPRPRRPAKARGRGRKRRRKQESEDESDADFEEEIETPRPKARRRARKAKPRDDDDDSDADFDDEEEDEDFEIDTPRPRRAPTARSRGRTRVQEEESDAEFDGQDEGFEIQTGRPRRAPTARSQGRAGKQEDESDEEFDGEEGESEKEEVEVEAPWPKRPATVRFRRRREEQEIESDADFKREEEEEVENEQLEVETPQPAMDPSWGRSGEQEDESDADFDGEEEELENEELEVETPLSANFRSGGRNVKEEDELDADFNVAEEEVEDQEEDEELEIETPESVKYRPNGRNLKQEDEFDADFNGAEEEVEDQEDDEELETETLQPRNLSEARGKGRKVKPTGSSRQRHEDDDDYEEEIEDEDEDFDPEVDEDEEDEEEDVEEEDDDLGDYAPTLATKVRPRNHLAKRKPAAGRQHRKRKSGSKGKTRNVTSARRRRSKRRVADDYEDDEEEEDDDDFVVKDDVEEEVNYRPRKKAKVGRKTREGTAEPVAVGEAWPSVESDTSEFEFVTSDEDHAEKETPVAEPARIKRKKGRRKRGSESDSSSDSDYVISEEELKDLGVPRPQETVPQLPSPPARRTIAPRRVDEKGKEPEEALKQICGICLSEEQRATIQGVLNCCSHYFCFACILEWSKVESRCPLCKRRFNTITKSSVADLGLGLRNAPVRVEKRDQVYQPTEDEMRRWLDPYENVVCIECNQGGDDNLMLLCDICDSSAHTFCVGLGREVPEGNWYCGGCRSSVEGPSHAQIQDRVVHRGDSNMNTADSSSGSLGRSTSSGVFQRPPPINVQPSLQGFDLNLSPIETPEEDKRAESHLSAEPVSTPTGRHATLDRRRALNRRIRILLFRPRTATNAWQNSIQQDRSAPGTEQNQRIACTSTDVSPSCSRADFMQSQQSSSHFVQSASNLNQCTDEGGSNFREVANAKDQLIPIVKKSIKHICARSPLDQSSFTNVARRATHTILALSGIAHNKDRVVSTPFPFPSHCCHACDGREPAFLMRTICSSCFNSFVGDVVSHIANMFS